MSIVSVLISLVVAFAVTAGLGFVIIPWLRKLHFCLLYTSPSPRDCS